MADEGSGATLTFGTSGTSLDIVSIQAGGVTREALETSHLDTSTGKTFQPGDLHDPGEISVTWRYNPNVRPPYTASAETITITYPVPAGGSSGATEASTGFITSWDAPTLENDTIMDATLTIKRSGVISFTTST